MRKVVGFFVSALAAVPIIIWLMPPWYASVSIAFAASMLSDVWMATWWCD